MLSVLCALLRVGGLFLIFLGAIDLVLAVYVTCVGVDPLISGHRANPAVPATAGHYVLGCVLLGAVGTFLYLFGGKVMDADQFRDEGKGPK